MLTFFQDISLSPLESQIAQQFRTDDNDCMAESVGPFQIYDRNHLPLTR
jgi:hypothetical protein